jgi:hypothetical protein
MTVVSENENSDGDVSDDLRDIHQQQQRRGNESRDTKTTSLKQIGRQGHTPYATQKRDVGSTPDLDPSVSTKRLQHPRRGNASVASSSNRRVEVNAGGHRLPVSGHSKATLSAVVQSHKPSSMEAFLQQLNSKSSRCVEVQSSARMASPPTGVADSQNKPDLNLRRFAYVTPARTQVPTHDRKPSVHAQRLTPQKLARTVMVTPDHSRAKAIGAHVVNTRTGRFTTGMIGAHHQFYVGSNGVDCLEGVFNSFNWSEQDV